MGKIIIKKNKTDYLTYIRDNIEPRKLRLLKKWDYWTGNFDPKKEFEGCIKYDSYLIRENHKMAWRSSPILRARIKDLGNGRIEVDYTFSVDKEVLLTGLLNLLLISAILFFGNMPAIAYIILLPFLLIFQIFSIWVGLATSKRKYLDFVNTNNVA